MLCLTCVFCNCIFKSLLDLNKFYVKNNCFLYYTQLNENEEFDENKECDDDDSLDPHNECD